MPQLVPMKYPLPLALVSCISCHLSHATAATPNGPPSSTAQAKLADVSFHAVPEPVPRTLRKHDQITIIVREESEFSSKGRSQFKKEAEFAAKVDEFIKLQIKNAEIEGGALGPNVPSIHATGLRDFKGEGQVDRSDSFTTRVQAEVVDVKPNGTLVLQARSHIKTDDEERFCLGKLLRISQERNQVAPALR